MAAITKIIDWPTGNGSVTLTYEGRGNGPITIRSDNNNLYTSRSLSFIIKTLDNKKSVVCTIIQQAKKSDFSIDFNSDFG